MIEIIICGAIALLSVINLFILFKMDKLLQEKTGKSLFHEEKK